MNYIRSIDWLYEQLGNENLCIVDCRFNLADTQAGEKAYHKGHIPGAFYADLDRDLSGKKQNHGGLHPLPNPTRLQTLLESFGITEQTAVIAYDDGEAMFAGRFWWLLSYLGHQKVYILDGGFQAWTNRGLPITKEKPQRAVGHFPIELQADWLASIDEVKRIALNGERGVLIDSRAPQRYRGETEPLDRLPGHIPTAKNCFFQEGLEGSFWKNKQQQIDRFQEIDREQPVIVYCGSGVSATPNILALKIAGFQDVKLYAGSYSDWSSYEELPVEKE